MIKYLSEKCRIERLSAFFEFSILQNLYLSIKTLNGQIGQFCLAVFYGVKISVNMGFYWRKDEV